MAKTAKKTSELVPFALTKIRTLEFAIIEESFSNTGEVEVSQTFSFSFDPETQQVAVSPRHEFYQKSPFLIIDVSCIFSIAPEAWKSWMNVDEGILVIPKNFATHMAVLTVGTTRGVLHAKTEGTYFNAFVLPTWNLSKVIQDDCVIRSKD